MRGESWSSEESGDREELSLAFKGDRPRSASLRMTIFLFCGGPSAGKRDLGLTTFLTFTTAGFLLDRVLRSERRKSI